MSCTLIRDAKKSSGIPNMCKTYGNKGGNWELAKEAVVVGGRVVSCVPLNNFHFSTTESANILYFLLFSALTYPVAFLFHSILELQRNERK